MRKKHKSANKKIDLTIRVFKSKNEMNFSVILKNDTNSFLR